MMKTLKEQKAQPKVLWGQNAGFEVPEFVNTLGDTTIGVLTRTVFIPKVGQVKPVAAKVNAMYQGQDRQRPERRLRPGLYRPAGLGPRTGEGRIPQAGGHPEGRQLHRDPG